MIVLAAVVLLGCGQSRIDKSLAPYKNLVRSRATEKQIIAAEGRPNMVIVNDMQLRQRTQRFRPRSPMSTHVEGKVLVYYTNPWGDEEGYVVYVILSKRGIATAAVFGG